MHIQRFGPSMALVSWVAPVAGGSAPALFNGLNGASVIRRRADPHITVTELTRKLEMWFAARGSRDIVKLLQPLRMANHTFKTGVAVGYHKQYNDDL